MGRSRSRSPDRRRRDRSRDRRSRSREDRRGREKKSKKRRHRSSSDDSVEGLKLGSILRKKEDRPSSSTPREVFRELESESFDSSKLSPAASKWIEQRIAEQVTSRVSQLESAMAEKISAARADMEQRVREKVEAEMAEEFEVIRRKEEDSRNRCQELEEDLKVKVRQAEESERKFNEERLAMLTLKSALEREKAELAKEKAQLTKNEQQTILNKGGSARAPIKFKMGIGK